jgi:hypothetical protein
MYCTKCGTKRGDGAFCSKCGNRLEQVAASPATPKLKLNRQGIIGLCAVVLCIVVIFSISRGNDNPATAPATPPAANAPRTSSEPARARTFDEKFSEAVALLQADAFDPGVEDAFAALFAEYPQEERLYTFFADEYVASGNIAGALSVLYYGYEITGSQRLYDRFNELSIRHDFGDRGASALEFAESLAGITGRGGDQLEMGRRVYSMFNALRHGS